MVDFAERYRWMTPEQNEAFQYLLADCHANSTEPEAAMPFYEERAGRGELRACEGLLDAYTEKLARTRSPAERRFVLEKSHTIFRWLVVVQLQKREQGPGFRRLLRRRAEFLREHDPEELGNFRLLLDRYGIDPEE